MIYYQDNYFYYFWKKAGVPTTYGREESFLDSFDEVLADKKNLPDCQIISSMKKEFGREKEYGLLNRLDNETSGLLYFAKTQLVYEHYKVLQSEQKIQKIYIADVQGNFKYENTIIDTHIYHHRFDSDKMVVYKSIKDENKIRGKAHDLTTNIEKLYFDPINNISTLQIKITKGIRHQIRVHLASIGYPIIGDKIYKKDAEPGELHLRSMGLNI